MCDVKFHRKCLCDASIVRWGPFHLLEQWIDYDEEIKAKSDSDNFYKPNE